MLQRSSEIITTSRIAIVGGSHSRSEKVAWPEGYDIRCYGSCKEEGPKELQKLVASWRAGNLAFAVIITKFVDHRTQIVIRKEKIPFKFWNQSLATLAKNLPDMAAEYGIVAKADKVDKADKVLKSVPEEIDYENDINNVNSVNDNVNSVNKEGSMESTSTSNGIMHGGGDLLIPLFTREREKIVDDATTTYPESNVKKGAPVKAKAAIWTEEELTALRIAAEHTVAIPLICEQIKELAGTDRSVQAVKSKLASLYPEKRFTLNLSGIPKNYSKRASRTPSATVSHVGSISESESREQQVVRAIREISPALNRNVSVAEIAKHAGLSKKITGTVLSKAMHTTKEIVRIKSGDTTGSYLYTVLTPNAPALPSPVSPSPPSHVPSLFSPPAAPICSVSADAGAVILVMALYSNGDAHVHGFTDAGEAAKYIANAKESGAAVTTWKPAKIKQVMTFEVE